MSIALLLALTSLGSFEAPATDIRGLWLKEGGERQEFRFYYFHGNGIGLYRYGRRHLHATNSYDYRVDGRTLELTFRKTGEKKKVEFERAGDYLILKNDPKEPGSTRYKKVEGPLEFSQLMGAEHPWSRMWTEQSKFATGGMRFRIYQFQPPDAQGKGIGWYHQGDYDDWTTEAFQYRKGTDAIHFLFLQKKDWEKTKFREVAGDKRAIELMSDPRNFWHRARFEDGGRSIFSLGGTAILFDPDRL